MSLIGLVGLYSFFPEGIIDVHLIYSIGTCWIFALQTRNRLHRVRSSCERTGTLPPASWMLWRAYRFRVLQTSLNHCLEDMKGVPGEGARFNTQKTPGHQILFC